MGAYLGFLGAVFLQWWIAFPLGRGRIVGEADQKKKRTFVILTCVEILLLAGLRATDLGADTAVYVRALNYYSALDRSTILTAPLVYPFDFEIGYFLLTKICAWLHIGETAFLFVIAGLIYIPTFRFIHRYSENPAISIYVYFAFSLFGYSLGIFRQMIATAIVLSAFGYILDRKFIRFAAMVLLAMTFHTTAVIALALYWLARLPVRGRLAYILGGEAVLFIVARPLIVWISGLFPMYAHYLDSQYDVRGGSYMMLLVMNAVVIAGYLTVEKTEEHDVILNISLNAAAVGTFLLILGYSMGIFGRIVHFYTVYLVLLLPMIANRLLPRSRAAVQAGTFAVLALMFYVTTRGSAIVPYATVFSGR